MFGTSKPAPPFQFSCPLFISELFGGLSENVQNALPTITKTRRFSKGESIFESGEMPEGILRIVEGEARLSYSGGPVGETVTRPFEPGEIWGVTELLAEVPLDVSLRSLTETVVEIIPAADFIQFVEKENELCFRLLRLLSSRYLAEWAFLTARSETD
jgi:CRP-like cAMP-binding protein